MSNVVSLICLGPSFQKMTHHFLLHGSHRPINREKNLKLCVIKSKPVAVNNPDEVKVTFIIIDKINGVPYLGFCTSTVGFSKTYAHEEATLLRASYLVAWPMW